MRAVVVHGEQLRTEISFEDALTFHRLLTQDRAGASPCGQMLALTVEGKHGPVVVVFLLSLTPGFVRVPLPPRLILAPATTWRQPWRP
jgi:hypothetical protein